MSNRRPAKYIRLNFTKPDPETFLAILGDPVEVRAAATDKSFIAVKENGITLSPGVPGKINIQGLPGVLKFSGLISETPFPLSMIPITIATPMPTHIFAPPLMELMKVVRDLSTIAAMFVVP